MYILKNSTVFLVPSTSGDKTIPDYQFFGRAVQIRRLYSLLFGGATTARTIGDYIGNDARLISEKIITVSSYADNEAMVKHYEKLFYLARFFAVNWQQETIGISINRTFYVIGHAVPAVPVLAFGRVSLRQKLQDKIRRLLA